MSFKSPFPPMQLKWLTSFLIRSRISSNHDKWIKSIWTIKKVKIIHINSPYLCPQFCRAVFQTQTLFAQRTLRRFLSRWTRPHEACTHGSLRSTSLLLKLNRIKYIFFFSLKFFLLCLGIILYVQKYGTGNWSRRKAWLLITIFAIHSTLPSSLLF